MSDGQREHVGSVTEEALKLLGALQDWAQDGAGDVASGAAERLHDLNEHVATGGADCRYCPVCRAIAAVRDTSPEVKEQLATAATSLLHAAAGILEAAGSSRAQPDAGGRADTAGRAPRDPGGGRREPVEKIDLDDDTEWED